MTLNIPSLAYLGTLDMQVPITGKTLQRLTNPNAAGETEAAAHLTRTRSASGAGDQISPRKRAESSELPSTPLHITLSSPDGHFRQSIQERADMGTLLLHMDV